MKKTKIIVKDERFGVDELFVKFQVIPLVPTTGKTLAVFEDGSSAIVESTHGRGRIFLLRFLARDNISPQS